MSPLSFDELRTRIIVAARKVTAGQPRAETLADLREVQREARALLMRNANVTDADLRASNERFLRHALTRLESFEALLLGTCTWGNA